MFLTAKRPLIWYVALIIITSLIYLIFSQVELILYSFYGLIILLAVLIHWFIIKNFNLRFNNIQNNYYILIFKLLFYQTTASLMANWLINNILNQSQINIRTTAVSHNLMLDHNFAKIISSWVNWLIFISLLLGINFYKYYFKYPNSWLNLAKCLLPTVCRQPWLNCYYLLVNIEASVKIISLISLISVITVMLFEIIIKFYNLFSFLDYPIVTACSIVITFTWLSRYIFKSIDFFTKNTFMDFVKIFMVIVSIVSIIIFGFNQIILGKMQLLNFKIIDSVIINQLFSDFNLNQDRIKILSLSVNILFSVCSSGLLLRQINGHKVGVIYLLSLIYPVVFNLADKFAFNLFNNNIIINFLLSLSIIIIILLNYRNIYSVAELIICKFHDKSKVINARKIKTRFSVVIKKIIYGYFFYLSGYYLFAWVFSVHILALVSIFLLPCVILLCVKLTLQKTKNHQLVY